MNCIMWKCGACNKNFLTHKQLLRHIEDWHRMLTCPICDCVMKKGSFYRHNRKYHKKQEEIDLIMDLSNEDSVKKLNEKLDKS